MRNCCKQNLEKPVRLSESLVVSICRVCGARHLEMEVDPGRVFGDGAET